MLALLLINWFAFFHSFFVSVTSVEVNQQQKSIEISSRIFFDDLEVALAKQTTGKVNIIKPANKQETERLLGTYLQDRFRVAVNGKPVKVSFVGYTIEDDAAWCFLEVKDVETVKELSVTNNILYEVYEKQSHILHVNVGSKRKSIKLDNPTNKATFNF